MMYLTYLEYPILLKLCVQFQNKEPPHSYHIVLVMFKMVYVANNMFLNNPPEETRRVCNSNKCLFKAM